MKLPSAPMTIGGITTFFKCQRVLISIAKLRYLLIFSFSFRAILQSPGHATSIIIMAYLVDLLNNYNVRSVVWHLLVSLDSEIPQNLYIRDFHHWFWGVLIQCTTYLHSQLHSACKGPNGYLWPLCHDGACIPSGLALDICTCMTL